jgi:hypothetical protein
MLKPASGPREPLACSLSALAQATTRKSTAFPHAVAVDLVANVAKGSKTEVTQVLFDPTVWEGSQKTRHEHQFGG